MTYSGEPQPQSAHPLTEPTPAPSVARVVVPVTKVRNRTGEAVVLSMAHVLSTLSRGYEFAQLSVQMSAGAGQPPSADWCVETADTETALRVANQLRTIGGAILTDIELGEPRIEQAPSASATRIADFVASRRARVEYTRWLSSAWHSVVQDTARWTLTVDVDALPDPATDSDSTNGDFYLGSYPEIPSPTNTPPFTRLVGARVSLFLHGTSTSASAITALFAEDTRGHYGLQPLQPGASRAPLTWLPLDLAAYLLSAPARVGDAFPDPPVSAVSFFAKVDAAATPHVLTTGGSGQGKTVFTANAIDHAARTGRRGVVIDVQDGELAESALCSFERYGQNPIIADFGSFAAGDGTGSHLQLRINLGIAPGGLSSRQWADDLYDLFRNVLWRDIDPSHLSKVGELCLRTFIRLVALDPLHETRFEDIRMLLNNPAKDAIRAELLRRIGDRELAATVEREVLPMLRSKDPDNAAAWMFSTLAPITDCWAFRPPGDDLSDQLGIETAVAENRPYVIHAPASLLGDTGSRMVITVMLYRLWVATRRESAVKPWDVFADEWQLYTSATLEAMLSQSRKFGGRLWLANQNFAQLPSRLRDSALANTGTLVCFRVGPNDAAVVDLQFPTIPRARLQTLPTHTFAVSFGDTDLVTAAPPPLEWD